MTTSSPVAFSGLQAKHPIGMLNVDVEGFSITVLVSLGSTQGIRHYWKERSRWSEGYQWVPEEPCAATTQPARLPSVTP